METSDPCELQEPLRDAAEHTEACSVFNYKSDIFYKGLFKDFTFCFL